VVRRRGNMEKKAANYMPKNKFLFYIFLASLFFIVSAFLFVVLKQAGDSNPNKVCFRNYCFDVELARTSGEMARGLMFRKSLEHDRGMLFIFKEEGKHSFWMKNTLIPLDIVWLNQDKEVVFIKKNFEPCTQKICPGVMPDKKAKYVLEVNAGIIEEIGLKVEDKMIF